jgi:hypothetical protein
MRVLGELSADGTGLGDARGQPNESMQIIYGLAELLATEHDIALESNEAWQFDLLRRHFRDCVEYALTLGGERADNKGAADVSCPVTVPPKWILAAHRWTDRAPEREKDDPLLESLLPIILAFVLDGSEQSAETAREWKGVSHAALLIAFHLGRLGKLGQLKEWLEAHP